MPCQTERCLCRYLISQHPAVEAKLAAELDEAGLLVTAERPLPRAMEYADLGRLTYLNWVCKVSNSYKNTHTLSVTVAKFYILPWHCC